MGEPFLPMGGGYYIRDVFNLNGSTLIVHISHPVSKGGQIGHPNCFISSQTERRSCSYQKIWFGKALIYFGRTMVEAKQRLMKVGQ
jgi:hypothetical protein